MYKLPDWIVIILAIIYALIRRLLYDNYGHTEIFMRTEPIVMSTLSLLLIWITVKDLQNSVKKENETHKLVFNYILLIVPILYLLSILGEYLNLF
ncbi:hypothetical protein [Senegalia massiliensis]|uniref:hypothetical protein n=1 Tax=Senegalia massiliensis TaxID=1720316 RepID=UPI0010302DBB|nr:hypothetical protein [Senegalia massiliensis]